MLWQEKPSGPTSERGLSRIGTNYGLQITLGGFLVLAIAFVVLSLI